MNTLIGKGKKWCVIAGLVVVTAAVALIFLYHAVGEVNARVAALLQKIQMTDTRFISPSSFRLLVSEIASVQSHLEMLVVQKDAVAEFIDLVEKTGREIGAVVEIDSVEPKEHPGAGQVEDLFITLHAVSTWDAVVRLVARMEFLPYETQVQSVTFSRVESGSGALWRVDFTFKVLKDL